MKKCVYRESNCGHKLAAELMGCKRSVSERNAEALRAKKKKKLNIYLKFHKTPSIIIA